MISRCLPKEIEKKVSSYEGLLLYTYTIGFPIEGEMILTFLTDGHKIVFSMVTDCYMSDVNICKRLVAICKSHKVTSIDVFVWTHPDEDHSKGIEFLLNSFDINRRARIYVPSQVAYADKLSDTASTVIRFLKDNYSNKHVTSFYPVDVSGDSAQLMLKVVLQAPLKNTIHLNLILLLPHTVTLFNKSVTKAGCGHNDLSIVYVLELNNMRYLFCGDLTKVNIPYIDNEYLHDIKFVKIPHHGSRESASLSDYLLQYGNTDTKMSTTVYKRPHYLPEEAAKSKYSRIGIGWCTGPLPKEQRTRHVYGCIRMVFDINGNFLEDELCLKGNSYKWI